MPTFGVTDAGFLKPTADEIEENLVAKYRAEFGADVVLTAQTYLGQQLAIKKKAAIEFWDYMEKVYYSRFGTSATGVNLERALYPFTKEDPKKASTILEFTGDTGTLIPVGTLAQTPDGINYATSAAATIETSGIVTVAAICETAGLTGNRAVDTITILPVTITGVDSVTNSSPAIGGADTESDADFFARVKEESQVSNSSSIPAIKKALRAVAGIEQVNVSENATDATDADGLPPNSVHVVVRGAATDETVAQAIFDAVAGGIGTYGSIAVNITEGNDTYVVRFDRSSTVNIYVDYLITTNAKWVAGNATAVKARCLEYVGGVDPNGITYDGIAQGEDVLHWKLLACLFNLGRLEDYGIDDVQVFVSKTPSPGSADIVNINIGAAEEAVTDFTYITVTTV